jgi:cytochrome c oxidase cbb3-type subunit 1
LKEVLELTTLHALAWLAAGCAVGLLLSVLLLVPELGAAFGPLTYGRWMPLHLDLLLYGWIALPLVALLFHAYQPPARAAGIAVQAWSGSLLAGAVAWLAGETTGKQLLDWQGISGLLFLASLLVLAGVLAAGLIHRFRLSAAVLWVGLLLVPALMAWAASPVTYPPVNPASGGPTIASLVWSTVAVAAIFALVPYLLGAPGRAALRACRQWLWAFGAWGTLLFVSSFPMFAPGLLVRVKFTNVLVGHTHLAMAGMATSFAALLLAALNALNGGTRLQGVLGDRPSFLLWNLGNAAQVLALTAAGALEAADPGVVFRADPAIAALYALRAVAGAAMLAAAVRWTSAAVKALP